MVGWIVAMAASVGGDDLYVWYDGAWGASLFFKEINKNVLNTMLGFASGVMIAASFWSLLDPAIARAEENGDIPWLVVSIGFGLGGLFHMQQIRRSPYAFWSES